jgi:hypothetical protein
MRRDDPWLRDLGDEDFASADDVPRVGSLIIRRFRPIAGPDRRIVRITDG